MIRRLALPVLLLLVPAWSHAQDACLDNAQGFDQWLNCRVERVVAAAAGPSGGEKQAEAPSLAEEPSGLSVGPGEKHLSSVHLTPSSKCPGARRRRVRRAAHAVP